MLHVYMFFSPSFFLFCTHYRKLCFVLSISQIFAQTLLSHIAFLVIWQISYFTRESCGTGLCWERHTPRGAPRLTWWMTAPPPIWSRAMWHVLISRCCTSTASKCLFFSFSRQQCFCVKWMGSVLWVSTCCCFSPSSLCDKVFSKKMNGLFATLSARNIGFSFHFRIVFRELFGLIDWFIFF